MKSKKKLLLGSILVFACTVLMAMPASAATTLSKSSTKKVNLVVGQTKTLKVDTSQSVTWSSSKKSVATVSKKGVVKAKAAGTTTIKAKVGSQTYKCKVTVKKNSWKYSGDIMDTSKWRNQKTISASSKKILAQPYKLKYNSNGKLVATIVVANLSNKTYTLKEISSVLIRNKNKNGTALAAGGMSVTATELPANGGWTTIDITFGGSNTLNVINLNKVSKVYCDITLN